MFKIKVIMQIHSCFAGYSIDDVWLERKFYLPFAPYPNLELGATPGWTVIIKQVYYDIKDDIFSCYIDPDKEFYNKGLREGIGKVASEEEMSVKINKYIADGWQREDKNESTKGGSKW